MEKFENINSSEQKGPERVENNDVDVLERDPEIEDEENKLSAEDVKNFDNVKKEAVRQEIGEIKKAAPEKENKEELLNRMVSKLEEMEDVIKNKKTGKGISKRMLRLFTSEAEMDKSLGMIIRAKELVRTGRPVDLHTIKNRAKYVSDVDVSDFPENPDKIYGVGNSTGYNVLS